MLFFGLVWVTSWIGYFLSFPESLPPMPSRGFTTKVSANVSKLVELQRPFFVQQKQHIDVWNTTLVPATLFNLNWGRKESQSTQAKPSVTEWNKSKNVLCRPAGESSPDSFRVNSTDVLPYPTVIEPPRNSKNFLPNKILRSLQNLFGFSHSDEPNFSSVSLPVVVVHRDKATFEVWANNHLIATLPNKVQARLMQHRLTQLLKTPNVDASQLRPALVDGMPVAMLGNRLLFAIEKEISAHLNRSRELLAIDWINNLRIALETRPLTLVEAQLQMYGLLPTTEKFSGLASWYGPYFHGRLTATGETYNQNELTAAHPSLPFNTYLQVTSRQSGNAVIVRVNDRGPFVAPRTLDLSRGAARCINSERTGVVQFEAVIMRLLSSDNQNTGEIAGLSRF